MISLEKTIQFNDKNYAVIGMIKDMIMQSPYKPVTPTVFFYDPTWVSDINVRIKAGVPLQDALGKIETVFQKI